MASRGGIALSWALALSSGGLLAAADAREAAFARTSISAPSAGELVRETYPNGAIKLDRHVLRDADGQPVLHGAWTMYAVDGRFLGGGEYVEGERHGPWARNFLAGEAELLDNDVARQFQPPFESQVTFDHGQMHGTWRIVDALRREVLAFSYDHGRRHGPSVWRFPNGQSWKAIDYSHDVVDGEFVEWNQQNQIVAREVYFDGRRLGSKIETYPSGVKKVEAQFLFAKEVVEHTDHWWNGVSRERLVGLEGSDQRHGPHTVWYENGRVAQQGTFERDQPHGAFIWWYDDGVRAIEGQYADGQQSGDWSWWFPNGSLRIRGHFAGGQKAGGWTWWDAEGRVDQTAQFNGGSPEKLASAISSLPRHEPLPPAPPLEAEEEPSPHKRPLLKRLNPNHR